MLPRALRITKPWEYSRVYKSGKRLTGQDFRIFYLPNKQNFSRFGFVVSKKQVKKIVARNRLKRILRAQIQGLKNQIPVGWDIVIHAKPNISDFHSLKIREELLKLFSKFEK